MRSRHRSPSSSTRSPPFPSRLLTVSRKSPSTLTNHTLRFSRTTSPWKCLGSGRKRRSRRSRLAGADVPKRRNKRRRRKARKRAKMWTRRWTPSQKRRRWSLRTCSSRISSYAQAARCGHSTLARKRSEARAIRSCASPCQATRWKSTTSHRPRSPRTLLPKHPGCSQSICLGTERTYGHCVLAPTMLSSPRHPMVRHATFRACV